MEKLQVKPKHHGTKQLFQNPILEKLSRTHIGIPLFIFFASGGLLAWYAVSYTLLSSLSIGFLFVMGLISFTFVEYWVHRGVYHIEPDTPAKAKFQYTAHGVHHEYPKDKTRLAMPPLLAIVVTTMLFGLFFMLMGEATYAFFPGFIWGYAGYLTVHYCIHAYAPPQNFLKKLWVHHAKHHYKDGKVAFGVSSPFWDYVFGTIA